jgi:hypothetical protein
MARLQLFEFEDQEWCPAVLRRALTGYLRLAVLLTGQARPVIPALADLLRSTGETSILDLCSGSGGIAPQLAEGLARRGLKPRIVLSDLHPDPEGLRRLAQGSDGQIRFLETPLDATAVPAEIPGLRTMFNAFHHLPREAAREVLAAAARSGRPIAIVEFVQRRLFSLSGVVFSALLVILLAPFLQPFRWQVLLFTWIVPVIPLMVLWDGLVSWLRVYSLDDLREMAASVAVPGYAFEAGSWRAGLANATYLVGRRQ